MKMFDVFLLSRMRWTIPKDNSGTVYKNIFGFEIKTAEYENQREIAGSFEILGMVGIG
ncbi:MAG: hypothetical protein WCW84_13620 [Sulfurimonas sp.]